MSPSDDTDDAALGSTMAGTPDTAAPVSPAQLGIGAVLGGRYRVERLLGHGGMGTVYLAVDLVIGEPVALKLVHRAAGMGSEGLAPLRDEVRLAQKVTHPNVCRTFDLEEADRYFLIKMEFVAGDTLARQLGRDGRVAIAEALRIARAIASGLAAAHARDVVHRDLKPHNVLIEEGTRRVVLMDFGLARFATATSEGPSGTPAYMAPEQIRGGAVDARTDLYALGCVLYEMLVGKVPLPAPSAAQNLQRHLDDRPTDPRAARPEVPRWLGRLCLRLLAKDPALRPQSAAETLRALDGPRWRRPALAGAALLALLAGTLAASLALRPKEWRPAVEEMKPSYEENSDHADVSPDGKLVAYPSDRDGNWGIYLAPLKGGPSRRVTRPDDRATSPRFSRDGKWLMFRRLGSPGTANQSGLYRVALDAGAEPELIELGAIGDDCGGRLLLGFRATGRLVVREAGGDREVLHVPEGYRLAAELRCDPAGKRFVYGLRRIGSELHSGHDGEDGEIWIAPLDGGAARPLFPDRRYAREPTFAADGRSVIYAGRPLPNDGKINLWEIAVEGGAARQITSGEGPDFAPAIASDGSVLLYNVDVTSKPLYQRTPAGDSRRISHTLDYVTWPRVTPDGRQVVAAVARHGSSRIVAFAVDSGDERVLADGDTAALAPDGREVLYSVPPVAGERRTRVFAVPLAGGSPRAVTEVEGRVAGLYTGGDDRVHLEVVAGSDRSAWFAPLAGGAAAREVAAPWSAVIPAPAGGWRIVERRDAVGASEARFVPPGAPLDAPEGRPIHNLHIAWFPDGKSIVYQTQSEVRRCTVGGEDALLRRAENGGGVAVAPDGQTVYYSALLGHVRRELITNFAERPRPTGR